MKSTLFLLIIICSWQTLNAQSKKDIYHLLSKGSYQTQKIVRTVRFKTERLDTVYAFSLTCDCKPGALGFIHTVNPERGPVNLPIRSLTNKELKNIEFLSLDSLVNLMKDNDNTFNSKFNLYLVEKGKVNFAYNVFKITSFGDYEDGY
ncbi:hypothetical protein D3C87_48970 [compost metagenome]|uniref:hypothetical protein n=1 Tax=Pedobacter sp. ok626 TaxID=1761882 RepID=UPI000FC334B8|nr:hypothetical protein [Pedobacter sp. ok626]